MNIYFTKTTYGLIPLYDSDKTNYDKIKIGDEIKAVITKPRNIRFHKKFFALLNLAFHYQHNFTEFEPFRAWILMKSGYVKTIATPTGTMFLPESISFAKMDEYKFEEVYNKVLDRILEVLDVDKEIIEQELLGFF